MEIMQRMNKKMDNGWKLTNSNCQKCNGVTMIDPNKPVQYYCPKCDKNFQFTFDLQQQKVSDDRYQNNQEDYFNQVLTQSGIFNKAPAVNPSNPDYNTTNHHNQNYSSLSHPISYQKKQQKTNNVSKKMGEKLIQGWAMLQQSCEECNVPLMKSKKGQKICCSCQKDYAKIQAEKQNKQSNNSNSQKTNLNKNIQQQKVSRMQQIKPVQKQENKITQKGQVRTNQISNQSGTRQKLVQSIEIKALRYLELKMDKAIIQNDIREVQRILGIIKSFKQ